MTQQHIENSKASYNLSTNDDPTNSNSLHSSKEAMKNPQDSNKQFTATDNNIINNETKIDNPNNIDNLNEEKYQNQSHNLNHNINHNLNKKL